MITHLTFIIKSKDQYGPLSIAEGEQFDNKSSQYICLSAFKNLKDRYDMRFSNTLMMRKTLYMIIHNKPKTLI